MVILGFKIPPPTPLTTTATTIIITEKMMPTNKWWWKKFISTTTTICYSSQPISYQSLKKKILVTHHHHHLMMTHSPYKQTDKMKWGDAKTISLIHFVLKERNKSCAYIKCTNRRCWWVCLIYHSRFD